MMPFEKFTQSEEHEVISDKEREVIRKHAGSDSASNLAKAERERLLRELELAQRSA